jgi:hypothetical protein
MGYHGTHRNPITGEWVAQGTQVCTRCYKNFASDDAWEKHWERKNLRGHQCLSPEEVGLISFQNSHGATVYRVIRQKGLILP